jgi:hypothetical protein
MGVIHRYCKFCDECFHEDNFCDFLCIICNESNLNICDKHISQLDSFDKNDLNLFVCSWNSCKEKLKKFTLDEVLKECYEHFGPDKYGDKGDENQYKFQIKLINRYNEILNSTN